MPSYVPVDIPGLALVSTTSAAVTGGQLVAVSGSGTVATCGAGSAGFLGVAAYDAASGVDLTVHCGGVQELTAAGSIAAGDPVISAAGGAVASSATPPAGQQVGIALTSAADAAKVRVKMVR